MNIPYGLRHGGKDGVRSTECGVRSTESFFYTLKGRFKLDSVFSTVPGGSVENTESILNRVANARQSN